MRQQRIIIIGGGIAGLSTAYALLSRGAGEVIVLEREEIDHRRSTSHGASRLLRFEYGDDTLYAEMVRLSLDRWRSFAEASHRVLYMPTGLLAMGRAEDNYIRSSYYALRELGMPIERLDRDECQRRFPQLSLRDSDLITYNPDGGILFASQCLRTLRDWILDLGGQIYEHCRITRLDYGDQARPLCMVTGNGEEIEADRVVLATGPWVHDLLAPLSLPVRVTRQYLLYFAGLAPSSYGIGALPAFIADDLYGFPLHDNGSGSYWLKAASHTFGLPVDPEDHHSMDEQVINNVTERLRDRLPALREAKMTRVDACMYDVTPDESFILDYTPDDPRVVLATGLSGHGFKFGLLLGEILCSLVRREPPPVSPHRFRLARFMDARSLIASRVAERSDGVAARLIAPTTQANMPNERDQSRGYATM